MIVYVEAALCCISHTVFSLFSRLKLFTITKRFKFDYIVGLLCRTVVRFVAKPLHTQNKDAWL